MQIEPNRFYAITELAGKDKTGLSYNYLRTACIRGSLKHIKAGSKYMISGCAILRLIGGDADATEV